MTLYIQKCSCSFTDREEYESERDWLKRCMCMMHWMQTDYYRNKDNNWKIIE